MRENNSMTKVRSYSGKTHLSYDRNAGAIGSYITTACGKYIHNKYLGLYDEELPCNCKQCAEIEATLAAGNDEVK